MTDLQRQYYDRQRQVELGRRMEAQLIREAEREAQIMQIDPGTMFDRAEWQQPIYRPGSTEPVHPAEPAPHWKYHPPAPAVYRHPNSLIIRLAEEWRAGKYPPQKQE